MGRLELERRTEPASRLGLGRTMEPESRLGLERRMELERRMGLACRLACRWVPCTLVCRLEPAMGRLAMGKLEMGKLEMGRLGMGRLELVGKRVSLGRPMVGLLSGQRRRNRIRRRSSRRYVWCHRARRGCIVPVTSSRKLDFIRWEWFGTKSKGKVVR